MDGEHVFMRSSSCGAVWESYRDFATDPNLSVVGYQPLFDDPCRGWILVTHAVQGCWTTVGVRVGRLRALYDGPEWPDIKLGTEECRELCVVEGKLDECDAECSMAWIRTVMQCLRRHELPPHLSSAALA